MDIEHAYHRLGMFTKEEVQTQIIRDVGILQMYAPYMGLQIHSVDAQREHNVQHFLSFDDTPFLHCTTRLLGNKDENRYRVERSLEVDPLYSPNEHLTGVAWILHDHVIPFYHGTPSPGDGHAEILVIPLCDSAGQPNHLMVLRWELLPLTGRIYGSWLLRHASFNDQQAMTALLFTNAPQRI